MKIDSQVQVATYEIAKQLPNKAQGAAEGKQLSREVGPENAGSISGDAVVHFSHASQEAHLADKIIEAAPDTRDAKVAEIKARVAAGDYKIDHEKIAAKMIEHDLEELF